MDTPTYEVAPEPDRTPRPNTILSSPATPADCARDYEAAKRIRDTMDKQDAR